MSRTFRGSDSSRDKKPGHKPDSDFKKARAAIRRAKSKQDLREMKDPEDFTERRFRKDDVWDWN